MRSISGLSWSKLKLSCAMLLLCCSLQPTFYPTPSVLVLDDMPALTLSFERYAAGG